MTGFCSALWRLENASQIIGSLDKSFKQCTDMDFHREYHMRALYDLFIFHVIGDYLTGFKKAELKNNLRTRNLFNNTMNVDLVNVVHDLST